MHGVHRQDIHLAVGQGRDAVFDFDPYIVVGNVGQRVQADAAARVDDIIGRGQIPVLGQPLAM